MFTIGEIPSNLTSIESTPKNNVVSSQRWVVLMDGVVLNGQNITGGSSLCVFSLSLSLLQGQNIDTLLSEVDGQTSGQTLTNLDTGTSLAQIPREYADVIYGSVPGSQLVRSSGVYIVPCDTKLNLSFVFSGVEYPVHPIDTVAATTDDSGSSVICYSGFTFGTSGSEDLLLGDSFLRNVYSLYDYGSFLNESSTPYIQLLSVRASPLSPCSLLTSLQTTDADQAYAEFDTLSQQRNQTLVSSGSSGGSGSGSSAAPPAASLYLGATMLTAGALVAALLVL